MDDISTGRGAKSQHVAMKSHILLELDFLQSRVFDWCESLLIRVKVELIVYNSGPAKFWLWYTDSSIHAREYAHSKIPSEYGYRRSKGDQSRDMGHLVTSDRRSTY